MKIGLCYAAAAAGVALFVGGCTSSGSSPAANLADHPHLLWAAPDINKTPRLLFLSGPGYLNIYSMPDMTLKAQWSGAPTMQGECPDTNGNIWTVDAGAQYLAEISRGGELHGILRDNYGTPLSCAVNPTNREVAVTNNGPSGGNVLIFPPVSGSSPTVISVPHMYTYNFDGYDRHGNLWVDGYTKKSAGIVAACRGSHCRTIPISGGTIFHPGFVQYVPGLKTWYVADRKCDDARRFCIYPVSLDGKLRKRIILTEKHGKPVCDMFQGAIADARSSVLVGGVDDGLYKGCGVNGVARWNFPAGGKPTNRNDGFAAPTGAAISTRVGGFSRR